MKIIKDHKDLMKQVVIEYRGCGHIEYYGMIYMRDGLSYCRACMYAIWLKEQNCIGWKPEDGKDFVFPCYKDGVDYYHCTEESRRAA